MEIGGGLIIKMPSESVDTIMFAPCEMNWFAISIAIIKNHVQLFEQQR